MATSSSSHSKTDSVALRNATAELFKQLRIITRGSPLKLVDEIQKMRDWLTTDRESRPSGYMNQPRAFSAYTAYHLPLHLTELFWILEQNFSRLGLSAPRRVLDIGAGPGTTSLSLLLWLQYRKQTLPEQLTLFDQSSRALTTGVQLSKSLYKRFDEKATPLIKSVRGNLNHRKDIKQVGAGFDWILLSHVLNEFGSGPRHRHKKLEFIESLITDQLPKTGGFLMIVEPPLRECTMDLMWLRDQLSKRARTTNDMVIEEDPENDMAFGHQNSRDASANDADDDDGGEDEEDFDEQDLAARAEDDDADESSDDDAGEEAYAEGDDEAFAEEDEEEKVDLIQATVIAPCPQNTVYCPMSLARAGWCYAQPPREQFRALGLTPWDYEIERALKIQWSQPGFSYLIIHAHGSKAASANPPTFHTSAHGIALTDNTRAPAMVCREKRIRKEDRAPFRGAYIDKKAAPLDGKKPNTSDAQKPKFPRR